MHHKFTAEECWGASSIRQGCGFASTTHPFLYHAPLGCCLVTWDVCTRQRTLHKLHSELVTVLLDCAPYIVSVSYHGAVKVLDSNFTQVASFQFASSYVVNGCRAPGLFAICSKGPNSTVEVYSLEKVITDSRSIDPLWQFKAPQTDEPGTENPSYNCFSVSKFHANKLLAVYQTKTYSVVYKFDACGTVESTQRVQLFDEDVTTVACMSEVKNNTFALGMGQGMFTIYDADRLQVRTIIQATGSPQCCTWVGDCLLTVSYLSGVINLWNADGTLEKESKGAPDGSIVHVEEDPHQPLSFWVAGIMSFHHITLSDSDYTVVHTKDVAFHKLTGCGVTCNDHDEVATGDFAGNVFVWKNGIPTPVHSCFLGVSVRLLQWWHSNTLVIGLLDGQLLKWKPGEEATRLYHTVGGAVTFKFDGTLTRAALGTTQGYLYMFNCRDGDILEEAYISTHHKARDNVAMEVWNLAWSPDNSSLATVSEDKTCLVADSVKGEVLERLTGHTSAVTCVDWRQCKRNLLITCADDKTARVYDGDSFQLKRVVDTKDIYGWHTLTYLAMIPERELLVISTQNGYLVVVSLDDFQFTAKYKVHCGSIEGMTSHKSHVFTIGSDCVVNKFAIVNKHD